MRRLIRTFETVPGIVVHNTRSTRRCKVVDKGSDKKIDLQPNYIAAHKPVFKKIYHGLYPKILAGLCS